MVTELLSGTVELLRRPRTVRAQRVDVRAPLHVFESGEISRFFVVATLCANSVAVGVNTTRRLQM